MMAQESRPYGRESPLISKHLSKLSYELVHADTLKTVRGVVHPSTWADFVLSADLRFEKFPRTLPCEDLSNLSSVVSRGSGPTLFATMVFQYSRPLATSCSEFKDLCDGPDDSNFLRLVCPITCGCRDLRSGLVPKTEANGCPMSSCQQDATYLQQLATAPCQDLTHSEIHTDPGWRRYFSTLRQHVGIDTKYLNSTVVALQTYGCQ